MLVLPQPGVCRSAHDETSLSLAGLVRRQGQEHQPRRRSRSRARAAIPEDLAALGAMVAPLRRPAAGSRDARCSRATQPTSSGARTSFRPQPAVGRTVSWRKDDSRLHIDAFPSRPNHGARILRVFCNVNPSEDRVWRVGERFDEVARSFLPQDSAADARRGRDAGGIARDQGHAQRIRSSDAWPARYRQGRSRIPGEVHAAGGSFRAGTTWLCFSDQVMHAAVSGQFMFEQTIHLPVSALYDAQSAPARDPRAPLRPALGAHAAS